MADWEGREFVNAGVDAQMGRQAQGGLTGNGGLILPRPEERTARPEQASALANGTERLMMLNKQLLDVTLRLNRIADNVFGPVPHPPEREVAERDKEPPRSAMGALQMQVKEYDILLGGLARAVDRLGSL